MKKEIKVPVKTKKELVRDLIKSNKILEAEDEQELVELLFDETVAVDVDRLASENEKWHERLADKITAVAGSWKFISIFVLIIIIWIVVNVKILEDPHAFDPYPFTLLNVFLSLVAALQAPFILMSQNRTSKKDSLRSKNDYKTDVKSELILEVLHDEIMELMKNQRKILELLKEDNER